MKNYFDGLLAHVAEEMNRFARRVHAAVPSSICDIGQYSNDSFLLRSFVSLRGEPDGEELALTVNIIRPAPNKKFVIECDLCMDDGRLVAPGPVTELLPGSDAHLPDVLLLWSKEFDEFLHQSAPKAIDVLTEMVEQHERTMPTPKSL